jgi:hypothetical protein
MFGRSYCEKYQSRDEKFSEPNGEGNLVSRLVFFANTHPKHDAKHIMTLPINQTTSVPKASTYIITTDVNLDNEYCLYSKYRGSSDIYRLLNPENVEMHKRYIKIRR